MAATHANAMHLYALKPVRLKLSPPRAQQSPSGAAQDDLVRSGAVRAIPPGDAAAALRAEGFRLLDVRPAWERDRARVAGSLHAALFVEDTDESPVTLLRKWVHFGYIGLWTGQHLTTINAQFLPQVEQLVPDKEAKLLVACGEGLRSLIAVKTLYKGGYKKLAWLDGGFNRSAEGDFSGVEGNTKLQYATVGGVSYIFLQILLLLGVVS